MDSGQLVICIFSAVLYLGGSFGGVDEEKAELRRKMTSILQNKSETSRKFESDMVILKLLNLPSYRMRNRIGVYANTELEVHTDKLIGNILGSGKECFIPRTNGTHMEMVILRSVEDYNNLTVNQWGFKEPDPNEERENALDTGGLDILVMPGLAFSLKGQRLGRGRGMYDRYIASIRPRHNPALIGLAYEVQLLKEIPMKADEDIKVDIVMHTKYLGDQYKTHMN